MPYQIITMPFNRAGKVFVPDEVNGFGRKKLEKYGKEITEIVKGFFENT